MEILILLVVVFIAFKVLSLIKQVSGLEAEMRDLKGLLRRPGEEPVPQPQEAAKEALRGAFPTAGRRAETAPEPFAAREAGPLRPAPAGHGTAAQSAHIGEAAFPAGEAQTPPLPPADEFLRSLTETGREEPRQEEKIHDPAAVSPDAFAGELTEEPPASPARPKPPFAPRTPPLAEKATWLAEQLAQLRTWLFSEGNVWVTVGVLLFIAAFGLLFSYVVQENLISLEMRLAGSAAVGIGMTAFGWRLRDKRRTYALILQGGGIGVLYVVLLAAAKLGGPVIPAAAAVVGMLLLSAFTVILSLMQDFQPLAIFALIGGYAAPILVSTGSSNFVALFSIYSLLNLEILAITTMRDWRKVRWGGFLASIVVGTCWGFLKWRPEYFASVEPFLILFFVNYSAVTLLPLLAQRVSRLRNAGRPDMPMAITLPFVFLFLQMGAASHTQYGIALASIALGAWYLLLGRHVLRDERAREAGFSPWLFLVYCILFSNLSIPFVFKQAVQAVSSTVWALEGAFLTAYAAKRRAPGALASGILLHAAALFLYNFAPYLHFPAHIYHSIPVRSGLLDWHAGASPFLLTGFLFAVSALASAFFCTRLDREVFEERSWILFRGIRLKFPQRRILSWSFALYGTVWWTMAVLHACCVAYPDSGVPALALLSLGGIVGFLAAERAEWRSAHTLAVPPVLYTMFFGLTSHPLAVLAVSSLRWPRWNAWKPFETAQPLLGWVVFAVLFALALRFFRSLRSPRRIEKGAWTALLFSAASYTSYVWSGYAGRLLLDEAATTLPSDLWILVSMLPPVAAAALLLLERFDIRTKLAAYRKGTCFALCAILLLRFPQFAYTLFSVQGNGIFSIYIPILNPLELFQLLYIAVAALLLHRLPAKARRIGLYYALPAVGFVWLHSVAVRAALWYFGESVHLDNMFQEPNFQALIAMLWGVTALLLIYSGKRLRSRAPWFAGAALLGLDIAKLLLVDLQNAGTPIRIVAFLVLGAFFLAIGWIAPMPPKSAASGETMGGKTDGDTDPTDMAVGEDENGEDAEGDA